MQVKRQDYEAWKLLVQAEELWEPTFFDRQTQVGFMLPSSRTICYLEYQRVWNGPPSHVWESDNWSAITFTVTTGLHLRCAPVLKPEREKEALNLISLMI